MGNGSMGEVSTSILLVLAVTALFTGLLLYYLLPLKLRRWVLLALSLGFYLCVDWRYMPFLLFVALTTYVAARLVRRARRIKWLVGGTIAVNVGVWLVIKEVPWLVATSFRVLNMLGIEVQAPVISVIVPLGLSYFTLQAIAYLVDVANGKIEAERDFLCYLLFLSWFPAIIQGPISRYGQLMPQLCNREQFSVERTRRALFLILIGAVKKLVIADRIGFVADYCFVNYRSLYGLELYFGAIAYSLQLYIDFSACVDIFRGISALFGVEMVHNFNRPYLATSIKEFWSRWHMSLSGWLKEYIYIPLGGSRRGKGRKYINIVITFLISGLWHGAGFNFFLWGLMHAIYQIVGDATTMLRRRLRRWIGVEEGSASERIYQTVITFHLVALAWIIFGAGGLTSGLKYVQNMLSQFNPWVLVDGSLGELGLSMPYIVFLAVHLCVLFAMERRFCCQEDAIESIMHAHLFLRWGVYIVLIFDVILFGVYGAGYSMSGFMYGGF